MNSFLEFATMCSGKNEQDEAMAIAGISREKWHIDGTEAEQIDELVLATPVLNVFKHGGYVQVDINFISRYNDELITAWNFLEQFCEASNSLDEESNDVPVLILTLVPVAQDGKVYGIFANPIFHTLQPEKPGLEATVIRMIFDEEDCQIYEETDQG